MKVGVTLGALVGLLFAVVDALWSSRSGGPSGEAVAVLPLLVRSVALLVPVFSVAGLFGALALGALGRISRRVHGLILALMPLAWAVGVFAYRPIQQLRLGYFEAAWWVPVSLIAAILSYIALRGLARSAASGRRRPALAVGVVAGCAWALSLVLVPVAGRLKPVVELPPQAPPSTAERPNVLLIVLDTVRADHMSCYGYGQETTPNIDRFAAEAQVFTNCLSPACWTLPSHASFFTGLPGRAHGVDCLHQSLDERFETLAEQLRDAGYQTVGMSSNVSVSSSRSFDQGFDVFWTPLYWGEPKEAKPGAFVDRVLRRLGRKSPPPRSKASLMHEELGRWFAEQYRPDEPFFIFLNYIEPHLPYVPPSHLLEWATEQARQKWKSRDQWQEALTHMLSRQDTLSSAEIAELENLYDDEITYVDGKVGELLDFLRANGLDEDMLIIILSDHGEHFGEHHMMGHEFSLYEPLVRVPLIVRYRDRFAPGMQDGLVQSHDVYPTILELAGIEWTRLPEQNCLSLLDGDAPAEAPRRGIAEYNAPSVSTVSRFAQKLTRFDSSSWLRCLKAVQVSDSKLIRWSDGQAELYDLEKDPLEIKDLSGAEPAEVERLAGLLDDWTGSVSAYEYTPPEEGAALGEITPEEIDALRGLGYVK